MQYFSPMTNANENHMVRANPETAFILGNGPSLADVSFEALREYPTFGMNAAYRYWREIDWYPTHYACLDLVVGLSHLEAIGQLIQEEKISHFLLRENLITELGPLADAPGVTSFDGLKKTDPIFDNVLVTTGAGAALWSALLGFRQIVLLGVDARYQQYVEGAERRDGALLEIVEEGHNPNYFFDGYQQPGDRYNVPDTIPYLHVDAWRQVGRNLKNKDISVYNANEKSAVKCFPFVKLEPFLVEGAPLAPPTEDVAPEPKPSPIPKPSLQPQFPAIAFPPPKKYPSFIKKNGAICLALAAGLLISLFLAELANFPFFSRTFFVLLCAAVWLQVVILLYVRHKILAHIDTLQHDMNILKKRLAKKKESKSLREPQ